MVPDPGEKHDRQMGKCRLLQCKIPDIQTPLCTASSYSNPGKHIREYLLSARGYDGPLDSGVYS